MKKNEEEAEEVVDIVDWHDVVISQKKRKELRPDDLHRAVHVFAMTTREEVIFQVRGPDESDPCKNMFDATASGHVQMGEDYRVAARRELLEEAGIDSVSGDLSYLGTLFPLEVEGEVVDPLFRRLYLYVFEGRPSDLVIETGKGVGFVKMKAEDVLKLKGEDAATTNIVPGILQERTLKLLRLALQRLRERYPKRFDSSPDPLGKIIPPII